MTKNQAIRYARLMDTLGTLGFSREEVERLLRAERTLRRWAEEEANGTIQREDEGGRPYRPLPWGNPYIPDREAGALRTAREICARHGVEAYHQGDPRGCALWVIRPGDVPEGASVASCYSNGVAVTVG